MSETLFKLENENKYNEVMKDHIATLTQLGDVQILSFANPNSIYFSTEFIFKDNKIFASGNVGNAVFVTTWKPAWDYEQEKTELEYFASKLKAFDDNKYIIDLEKAEKEITRWIVEADDWEEPYEIADELVTEVLWENLFEEFEDKKISNKDNSKHLLKICSKLLEALYNADNYIEYNNSLTL